MKRPQFNHRRILVLCILLLLVVALLPAPWAGRVAAHPRHIVAVAISPIRSPLTSLSQSLRGRDDLDMDLGTAEDLDRNYAELLAERRRLEAELRRAQDLIAQLSELRQLPLQRVASEPADVSGSSVGAGGAALTLNRGTRHGLAAGMVVVRGGHLVGRVTYAGRQLAQARLVTSPGTQLLVRISPPRPDQTPREHQTLIEAKEGGQFVGRADAGDPVEPGDLAHLADPGWPPFVQGMIVGKVTTVQQDPQTPFLRNRVVVEPIIDLRHVRQVLVLKPDLAAGMTGADR